MVRHYRYMQRGAGGDGFEKKKKLFDIKSPNRYDIPIYKDVSNLKKKYKAYKKRKNKQQKGGFLTLLAGLGALGGLSGLFR